MGKKKNQKKTKKEIVKTEPPKILKNILGFLIMGSVILFVSIIRLRLLDVPLERDEGEYAYMGQLLLQGILPYTEAYNMKLPGIYFVYALILLIFGQTHTGIHLALLFVNIATSIVLFLLSRLLISNVTGIATGISFLLMTLSPSVQGFWANSEHFVILPATGGILLMLMAIERNNTKHLFLSSLLLGTAFLIKQHGILFLLFGVIYVCWSYLRKTPLNVRDFALNVGVFILGALIPFCVIVVLFLVTGNFDRFWLFTFKYAYEYVSMVTLSEGITNFKVVFTTILKSNLTILMLSLLGLIIIWYKETRSKWIFCYGFFIASFLAVCPGLYFREHYFIFLLPALSLQAGIGAHFIIKSLSSNTLRTAVSVCIMTIVFVYPVLMQKKYFFKLSPVEACRVTYGPNPFPESLEVAKYIHKNTDTNERIAVLGSEPQIYFYAKRRSATSYIYMYTLTEPHKYAREMQQEMIRQIESCNPKYVVVVTIPTSWLMRPDSERLLMNWMPGFLEQRYTISGIADIISPTNTIYKWGNETLSYNPRSISIIAIYTQKDNPEK